jgi:hypothetical protein
VEQLVELRLAGESEVLGKNLPQRHFVLHKSDLTRPGIEPDRRGGKPATNRLSYGAAKRARLLALTENDAGKNIQSRTVYQGTVSA